jgi:hypothetical protein
MTTFLLNGCSYAETWKNVNDLADMLGYDNCVNLGRSGSSNDRIFRSTVDYIISNPGAVDFVTIMTTFWNRFDAPWGDHRKYEGPWLSYSTLGIINKGIESSIKKSEIELKLIDNYIVDRFRYDLEEIPYINQFGHDLILFTSWLDYNNIKYCLFNSSETQLRFMEKLPYLSANKKIINLVDFISNRWMHEQGATRYPNDRNVNPESAHYKLDGYKKLNDFLYNYITEHCL